MYRMGCSDTNKKNKLQNPSVIRKTNLLSLMNPLLAHVTVAPHCQIMDKLGLKNSSRKTVSICAFSFINSLYLILHAFVQTSDRTTTKV